MDEPNKEPQPWWNDGDKVSGMVATILMLGVTISAVTFLSWLVWKWTWG